MDKLCINYLNIKLPFGIRYVAIAKKRVYKMPLGTGKDASNNTVSGIVTGMRWSMPKPGVRILQMLIAEVAGVDKNNVPHLTGKFAWEDVPLFNEEDNKQGD
jgi:hypothetical protein